MPVLFVKYFDSIVSVKDKLHVTFYIVQQMPDYWVDRQSEYVATDGIKTHWLLSRNR